jgi:hypothetical protein
MYIFLFYFSHKVAYLQGLHDIKIIRIQMIQISQLGTFNGGWVTKWAKMAAHYADTAATRIWNQYFSKMNHKGNKEINTILF